MRVDPQTGARTIISDATTGSGPPFQELGNIAVEATGDLVTADHGRHAVRIHPVTGDRTIVSAASTGAVRPFSSPQKLPSNQRARWWARFPGSEPWCGSILSVVTARSSQGSPGQDKAFPFVTPRRNPGRRSHLHRGERFTKTPQGASEEHRTDGCGRGELRPHHVESRPAVQDGLGETHKMRRR